MWYQKYRDERVEALKSQIFREMYYWMMGFTFLSIIIKSIMYPEDWKRSAFEMLLMIFSSLYYIFRSVLLGLYSDEVEMHDRQNRRSVSQKNLWIGLGSGLAIALYFGFRSAIVYGSEGTTVKYFFASFFGGLLIYIPVFLGIVVIGDLLAHKGSKRMQKSKNEEEE